MTEILRIPKRLLVGRPLLSSQMGETLLPKKLALPVFCSDPLSSNAYATEEILLVLSLGGLTLLHLTPLVAAGVVLLLVVVVLSYRQTCHAYPDGGGAYAVSRANLGRGAALVAASALLVDYVLTVAVSVAAGVANIVSAVPALVPHALSLSVGLVALLAVINLRGVKESGVAFAVPTYGFVAAVFLMLGLGLFRTATGAPPVAESATLGIRAEEHASGPSLRDQGAADPFIDAGRRRKTPTSSRGRYPAKGRPALAAFGRLSRSGGSAERGMAAVPGWFTEPLTARSGRPAYPAGH